jgi:hypothetical protein
MKSFFKNLTAAMKEACVAQKAFVSFKGRKAGVADHVKASIGL